MCFGVLAAALFENLLVAAILASLLVSRAERLSMEDAMVKKIALGILLASITGVASATPTPPTFTCVTESFWIWSWQSCTINKQTKNVMSAPEIDPASAVAGLTLLIGGLAVMRGRRNIKATA
jgi:hypothetical protein